MDSDPTQLLHCNKKQRMIVSSLPPSHSLLLSLTLFMFFKGESDPSQRPDLVIRHKIQTLRGTCHNCCPKNLPSRRSHSNCGILALFPRSPSGNLHPPQTKHSPHSWNLNLAAISQHWIKLKFSSYTILNECLKWQLVHKGLMLSTTWTCSEMGADTHLLQLCDLFGV